MAFYFNGNTPKEILYNGLNVAKLAYNGVVVWSSGLPTGYTQVEYLESTGTQYIDTGFTFTGTTCKIYADFSVTTFPTWWVSLCATQKDSSTRFGGIQFNNSINYLSIGNKSGDNGINLGSTVANTRYQIELIADTETGKLNATRSDNKAGQLDIAGSAKTGLNIYLFCKNTNNNKSEYIQAKLYDYKIYENGVLVRNMIPCKNPSNVAGMYDTVNDVFYSNAGTGTFNTGAVVSLPHGYTQLEYIQSTGTQYIDTGVIGNEKTAFELNVNLLNLDITYPALFGSRKSNADKYIGLATAGNYLVRFMYGNTLSETNFTSNIYWTSYTGNFHKFSLDLYNQKARIDNNEYIVQRPSAFSTQYSMCIFNQNIAGNMSNYPATMMLKECKIWDNGVLVRNFIPCKNPSNVVGLYDIVNDVFYTNAGTGSFIAGAEV